MSSFSPWAAVAVPQPGDITGGDELLPHVCGNQRKPKLGVSSQRFAGWLGERDPMGMNRSEEGDVFTGSCNVNAYGANHSTRAGKAPAPVTFSSGLCLSNSMTDHTGWQDGGSQAPIV